MWPTEARGAGSIPLPSRLLAVWPWLRALSSDGSPSCELKDRVREEGKCSLGFPPQEEAFPGQTAGTQGPEFIRALAAAAWREFGQFEGFVGY